MISEAYSNTFNFSIMLKIIKITNSINFIIDFLMNLINKMMKSFKLNIIDKFAK